MAEGSSNLILRNYLADVNRHLRIVRRLGFTRSERIGQSRRRQARSNCASRARVFYATPLQEILQQLGVTHLLFTGVTTEVCVQTTMREANDRGYACLLVEDGTESYFPEFKEAVLDMITAQGGIVGWTATCDAVCAGLERAYG